jgi:mannose-6-phosphate isomerase-like protein (cupin superfamily)
MLRPFTFKNPLVVFLASVLPFLLAFNLISPDEPDFEIMLRDWSTSFLDKTPQNYNDTLNFKVQDDDSYWHVIFSDDSFVMNPGKSFGAKIILTASLETYRKVYYGELSPITAAGRASRTQSAPLDFILEGGMKINQMDWDKAYFTLINFFNHHPHNKTKLGREYSRTVHGANVVGLYYSVGFRSAWYHILPGQTLNEDGEKDPFKQSFIITSGTGFAKLGNDTIEIKANEAYYIKPYIEHKVWTDNKEGISIIWHAWGEEAW